MGNFFLENLVFVSSGDGRQKDPVRLLDIKNVRAQNNRRRYAAGICFEMTLKEYDLGL
jgi:hypothetical protein